MTDIQQKAEKSTAFVNSIWGLLTIIGVAISGVIGGYWWLQDSIVERNAKVISSTAIEEMKKELDPLSRTLYLEHRRRDSIERLTAEGIALTYMNRSDSLGLVLLSEMKARSAQARQLNRIEARLDTDQMDKLDDQLARIWKHLQEQNKQDSLLQDLSGKMDEIRALNRARIENVKSGERIR